MDVELSEAARADVGLVHPTQGARLGDSNEAQCRPNRLPSGHIQNNADRVSGPTWDGGPVYLGGTSEVG